jgi:enoyl-CoA hydratase
VSTTEPMHVSRRDAGGVVTVELANAKSVNILGSAAIEELTSAFQDLSLERDVRVVVLRGSGDKAFIGGADINEMAARMAGLGLCGWTYKASRCRAHARAVAAILSAHGIGLSRSISSQMRTFARANMSTCAGSALA